MPDRISTVDRVLAQRLTTQGLTGRQFTTPAAAVRHLLAVQAQDAPLARWSLSLRSGGPDDASVRAAVDDGTLVRTHLLRPTWHYVAVEDLRWLLDLTGPKVLRTMGSRMRALGLEDPAVVRREVDSLVRRLAGHPLTRRQIVSAVGREDLKGERLGFVIGVAELEGLVCSGPLDRGQHTYALVEERVPPATPKDRDEALRELVLRFFSGHGPASVAHLVRWSTLTKREVVAALDDLGDRLERTDVNGEPHWCAAEPADACSLGGRVPAAGVRRGLPDLPEQQLPPGAGPPVGRAPLVVRRVRRRRGRARPARRGLVETQRGRAGDPAHAGHRRLHRRGGPGPGGGPRSCPRVVHGTDAGARGGNPDQPGIGGQPRPATGRSPGAPPRGPGSWPARASFSLNAPLSQQLPHQPLDVVQGFRASVPPHADGLTDLHERRFQRR